MVDCCRDRQAVIYPRGARYEQRVLCAPLAHIRAHIRRHHTHVFQLVLSPIPLRELLKILSFALLRSERHLHYDLRLHDTADVLRYGNVRGESKFGLVLSDLGLDVLPAGDVHDCLQSKQTGQPMD